jgi:cobalt-zinc-cadmium efflux system protein
MVRPPSPLVRPLTHTGEVGATRHHGHHHARLEGDRRVLLAALAIVLVVMGAEIAAGIVAHSLALLADAGHMVTDAAALVFAVIAARMAARPAGGRWTFGYSRLEILSAQANGIALALVAAWVTYAAIRRLIAPHDVRGGIVVVVAICGALAAIAGTLILGRASRDSLNVRGAFVHLLTDVAAFAAAAVAGALVLVTGWNRFDPVASLVVAALMLTSSWRLLRESTEIFMETSGDIDPAGVERALAAEPDVVSVHDLHVWTVTSGFPAVSAHVLVAHRADCHAARARLERLLVDRFGLAHSTLQVEHAPPGLLRDELPMVRG